MTTARITIEPMQPKYNPQVGRLLVHGFRGKFQHLTNMSDDDHALFFEKLFDYFPTEASNQKMIALQEGEVIGTLSIKWYVKSNMQQEKQNLPPWKSFNSFGIWNFLKLLSLPSQIKTGGPSIRTRSYHSILIQKKIV
ncbi:hypothetical protein [Paenibacillus glacialis]|uniref:N-acetyltransferase domain-containing protein n=1 Tax=Paenibacillus glacialis TaxID=494026 RepID=A0A168KDR1_9BACL|nr:hypothetical protein [Paenibacillus glacialis]OAB41879.1 hypothetical protein PGLA_14890 [Paenibacillus glacialis]